MFTYWILIFCFSWICGRKRLVSGSSFLSTHLRETPAQCRCYHMYVHATFNNISVISWQSVLFLEETGVPGENHRPVASHSQTLSHNVVLSTPCHEQGLNSQFFWWQALIAQLVVNSTTIRSWPRRPLVTVRMDPRSLCLITSCVNLVSIILVLTFLHRIQHLLVMLLVPWGLLLDPLQVYQ